MGSNFVPIDEVIAYRFGWLSFHATTRYQSRGSGEDSILPGGSPLKFGSNEYVTLVPTFFYLGLSLGTQRQSFCSDELLRLAGVTARRMPLHVLNSRYFCQPQSIGRLQQHNSDTTMVLKSNFQ
jgi:hypothetical protein